MKMYISFVLILNYYNIINFIKIKYFYLENTMKNNKFFEINLSQYEVWEDF
jgi:predicted transcriptional regulator of viral defense system